MFPQKDRERSVYGLKEKNLAKTYIKLIPLGMRDPDAMRLLNWKKPTERDVRISVFPLEPFLTLSKEGGWRLPDRSIRSHREAFLCYRGYTDY